MDHIYAWEPISVILLIIALVYLKRRKAAAAAGPPPPKVDKDAQLREEIDRITAGKPEDPPEVVYMDLRDRALGTPADRVGGSGENAVDGPYGALMEMGIPNSVVTLACFANGDASLYYRTGGGMRGGIAHESVRKVAKDFLAASRQALPRMIRTTSYPLPGPDRVRFYVLTKDGTFTTETDRESLGETASELSALFYSGQAVVSQMREVQEQKGR